jgi:hypothetical protein
MPETVKHVDSTMSELARFVNSTERSESQLLRRIEALDVSADIKALFAQLLRVSSTVGNELLRIGRKVVDVILAFAKQFPQLTFSVATALVVGALLAAVPLLGSLLAPVLAPLGLALGVAWGAMQEMRTPDLDARVREFAAAFSGVSA